MGPRFYAHFHIPCPLAPFLPFMIVGFSLHFYPLHENYNEHLRFPFPASLSSVKGTCRKYFKIRLHDNSPIRPFRFATRL